MPPGRQAVVAPPVTLHADDAAQARSSARSKRKGRIRQSRSIPADFTGDAPNAALGNAIRVTAVVRVPHAAKILAALAPRRRLRTRQSVAPPPRGDAAAKFFPVRGSRNLFLLSARGHEAIMTAREEAKETKRS
jgi:hypothetical protein